MAETKNLKFLKKLMLEALDLSEVKALDGKGETVHGQEFYDILPDKLYHATSGENWPKIQKAGYLGSEYKDQTRSKGSNWVQGTDRKWQKPGTGVFLATSTLAAKVQAPALYEPIYFEVDKSVLKPELCYFDGDNYDREHPDRDLEDYDPYSIAVFYAGWIPLKDTKQVDEWHNVM